MDSKELKWANQLLRENKSSITINSVQDLIDGVALVTLLEIITGKKDSRMQRNPKGRIQAIENVSIALSIMQSIGINEKCSPSDFIDGNEKNIQGVIYRLYLWSNGFSGTSTISRKSNQSYQQKQTNNNNNNNDSQTTTPSQTPPQSTTPPHNNNNNNNNGIPKSQSLESIGSVGSVDLETKRLKDLSINTTPTIVQFKRVSPSTTNGTLKTSTSKSALPSSSSQDFDIMSRLMGSGSTSPTSTPPKKPNSTPPKLDAIRDKSSGQLPIGKQQSSYHSSAFTVLDGGKKSASVLSNGSSSPKSVASASPSSSSEDLVHSNQPGQRKSSFVKSSQTKVQIPSNPRSTIAPISTETDSDSSKWKRTLSSNSLITRSRLSLIEKGTGEYNNMINEINGGSEPNTPTKVPEKMSWIKVDKEVATTGTTKRKAFLKKVIVDTERYNNPDFLPAIIQCQSYVRRWCAVRKLRKIVKDNIHRNRVFKEILSSEESYVQGIDMIVNVFYQQIVFNNKVSPTPYLTQDGISTIFSTVNEIQKFNRELLQRLRKRAETWDHRQKLGDIFVALAPYLKLYKTYCLNYDSAIECLAKAKRNETFKMFIKACLDHPENNMKQSLESLLIIVVQRIPRYILLLQDLLRHTWKTHNDYEDLTTALKHVQNVADAVNSSIKMAESQAKVLEIQRSLIGWDDANEVLVNPSRYFIKQGLAYLCQLDSRFAKDILELVVFFFNDAVLFTEKRDSSKYQVRYFFKSNEVRIKDVEDSSLVQNAIQFIGGDSTAMIAFSTIELKRSMMNHIDRYKPHQNRPVTMELSQPPSSASSLELTRQGPYTITIGKTEKKKVPGKKEYTVYQIDILNEGTGEVETIEKRYSDFDSLHSKLKKKFPDVTLKELPKKHLTISSVNTGSNTVESRRVMLQIYLQDLFLKENIKNSTLLLTFINQNNNNGGIVDRSPSSMSLSKQDSSASFDSEISKISTSTSTKSIGDEDN